MRDIVIACGGAPGSNRDSAKLLELDISPDAEVHKRIRFDPQSVVAPLLDDLPDVLADVLEIAAYVFSADRQLRRGSEASPGIGAEWQRRMRFRIPVRQEALWNSRSVKDGLTEALSFLSGDDIEFDFSKASQPRWAKNYLGFKDAVAQTIRPDIVMMFSGGLDSLAGVAEQIVGDGRSSVLVTHQSSTLIAQTQNELAREINRRVRKGQIFYAPVWVRRGKELAPVEHTQRLRSFLFAALGVTHAWMFGCSRVQFCENGITSFNLPMAQQVVGTRASRTTHPKVLAAFTHLFSLILEKPITLENPFLWKTKVDVVEVIARNGLSDLIALTRSCANVRSMSISGHQCGCCSQCVERQYAVLAAGIEHLEPPGTYERDLFLGAHNDGRDFTMVESHLRRAGQFASMSQHAFLSKYGQVFRALSDIGGTAEEAAAKIFDLHHRYGEEIMKVFNKKSQENATLDALIALPVTSLLALVRAPYNVPFIDSSELEPAASVQAASDTRPTVRQRVIFAIDESGTKIRFDHGIKLGKKSTALLVYLAKPFCSQPAGTEHEFIPSDALCIHLNCDNQDLRQLVARIRQKLRTEFERSARYTLDIEDVIQSKIWRGYRLNPYLVMVDWKQLHPMRISRHSV